MKIFAMRQLLQCVAVRAVCCIVLQRVAVLIYENVFCGVALALWCSVLQCVAVCSGADL